MTGLSGRARERRGFLSLDEFLRTSHLFQRIEKTSTVETGHCRRGKRLPRLVLSWHGRDSREALSPFELSRTLFLSRRGILLVWEPAISGSENFFLNLSQDMLWYLLGSCCAFFTALLH